MKYTPHPYQAYCEEQVIERDHLGLLLEMGLGKTVIALSAILKLKYDYLQTSKTLIIAPLKVAEATWSNEIRKWDHLNGLTVSLILGSEKQRLAALSGQADIYVINRDNVVWLVEHYKNAWPFDTVIIDELSSFKNPMAKRFRALKAMLPHISRVIGLTGTPAPNGMEDLWAQIYLLDGGKRLGRTITWYREQYFKQNIYTHEHKIKAGSEEIIRKAISDICISLKAEDYLAMPELMINDIPVALDAQSEKAYKRLERDMLLDIDYDKITAASAAVLANKLLQLCGGAVYTDDGKAVHVHDCKLEALQELVEGLQGQHALLFYGYRHDIPRLLKGIQAVDKDIRIRQLEGAEDCEAWNRGEVDILLAHPASCAYGLNLQQGGHHVIWFCLQWSLELYQQANARLWRQGQEHPVIIHRLMVQGGMDEDVAKALEGKRDTQDALMDALKARIGGVK